ncbi:LytR C-terminal domain-containing protein [Candidatus Roizmanbacteria bacterium]|nr:LytR C-terminal domain-containing protein [Candidatus Roizmanbacteria bacterium]
MIDIVSPYSNQPRGSKKKKIAVMIGAVVIAAVLFGGTLILRQSKKTDQTKTAVVENKKPSPTEKPKIDKDSVKIQVLNGTGTPGQAGTAVEALKKAGYSPDNIKTANAKDFNNTITTITARAGFENTTSDISDVLKSTFSEIKIETTELDEKSEFDIVITTGGKKFEEVTPTATITPTQNPTPSPTSATTTPTLTPSPTTTPSPT